MSSHGHQAVESAAPELLTAAEHELLELTGEVANRFRAVLGDGELREADWSEAVHHIHGLQHMVMANAAARAYPDCYRLKGRGWKQA